MFGMGYFGFYYDPTYILVIIGAIISIIASAKVNGTFNKYNKVRSMSNMTGAMVARKILDQNGLSHVKVEHISGNLSDHYDPSTSVVRLSDATYNSTSVAAIGVAAHECGHALQHKESYTPLKLRSAIFPAASIGSKLGLPLVILGILLSYNVVLIQIGIWVFSLAVFFQLVTLPVEFNASSRALGMLERYGILGQQEIEGSKKVLSAAAMTYVAAAAASILQLLRLVMLFGNRSRD